MYDIIPLFLLLLRLFVVLVVMISKFTVLASFDQDPIKEEKESQCNAQIKGDRIKRSKIQ